MWERRKTRMDEPSDPFGTEVILGTAWTNQSPYLPKAELE